MTQRMRLFRPWRPDRQKWLWVAGAILACIALLSSVLALAPRGAALANHGQTPPTGRQTRQVPLPGAVPHALGKAKLLRHEDSVSQFHLSIALALPNPTALTALIASQQDPTSPQYHKYLTAQAFTDRFSPSAQSVTAVRQFLTSAGFKVTSVSSNRLLVDATGSLTQVERTFGVTIGRYQLGKRTVFGPEEPPSIPDSLASIILNVGGLDNVTQLTPQAHTTASSSHMLPMVSRPSATSTAASGTPRPHTGFGGGYTPTELRAAYDVAPLISAGGDGTGQRVAVFELAPYIPGDISTYRSQYGLPSATINAVAVDGATTTGDDPGTIEADLDIETMSALAPHATQDVYVGPDPYLCTVYNPSDPNCNSNAFLDVYNRIVTDNVDHVITTSWGGCEPYSGSYALQALDNIFSQAAAQGTSVLAAAGDFGSDDCYGAFGVPSSQPSVDSPADDPYVTGVGGTNLVLGSGPSYGSETTWNSTCGSSSGPIPCGGGGGLSGYFNQPTWQVGVGVNNNGHNGSFPTGLREVPDVAADADPNTGYSLYCTSTVDCYCPPSSCSNANWWTIGGTSAAAPLWAGILADANGYIGASAPGVWNPTLYKLLNYTQAHAPYHDVTSGTNDIDFSGTSYAGDYPATPCYDMTTGVGTPDAWNIAQDVKSGVNVTTHSSCYATPPNYTNLIQDGGFEQPSGSSPWQQYSAGGYPMIVQGANHTGKQAFVPCGYAACDDRVSQTITVPATVTSATLRYWLSSFSTLSYTSLSAPCLDHLYVTLATPDGTVVSNGVIPAKCETDAAFGYTFETVDLTALLKTYAGKQLVLMFRGTTTNVTGWPLGYTYWGVDDASLLVS